MNYKNILVTGGAGFIGSNLAIGLKRKYPKVNFIVLDNLIRRGSELNVSRLKSNGITFIKGDIRNKGDFKFDAAIDLILECSAEPSVLSGYGQSPEHIITTNLFGTVNCLEFARENKADMVFLSTSRIYSYESIGNIKVIENETRFCWDKNQNGTINGWSKQGIDENFTLEGPKSMYGATKLASEILLNEYISMYGIKGVINRCGVIAGPWQFGKIDQGIFTFWMLAHYFKKPLKYIGFEGKGKQVRDVLHIEDLFELIDLQINSLDKISGQTYNVGGGIDISLSLLETTKLCQKITGNNINIEPDCNTRPADLAIYITDNKKVNKQLGWQPKKNSEQILKDIYSWVKDNDKLLENLNFLER